MSLFFQYLLFLLLFYQNLCQVIVNTTRGQVIGYYFDRGNDTAQTWYGQADVFLGIPYALPPIGNLRYKLPRPLVQFQDMPHNATYARKMCVQPRQNLTHMSEDCLYINIFTPNASSTTKYPVLVWIHGGGLLYGDNLDGPNSIVRNFNFKGVVVASLAYRLGYLGFFTTLTDDFPSNLGLLDQTLALKFIKEEIGYFGGDSNKITIFGESAGGHSVSTLTYSPLSQNLFQQYIAQSGTVHLCFDGNLGPTDNNFHLAHHVCNYTQEMWDSKNFTALKSCLISISVEDALAANGDYNAKNSVCWDMVQDNYFFPGNPQTLGPKRPNIPAIVGTCKDEYAWLELLRVKSNPNLTEYTKEQVESRLSNQYSPWFINANATGQVIQLWENTYLPPGTADDDHMAWLQFEVDIGTAAFFTKGSLRDVEYYIQNNNPNVYLYQFSWSSSFNDDGNPLPNWHPAPHGCETGFLLGFDSYWNGTNLELSNNLTEMWTNFAKNGNPTPNGLWKPSTSKNYTAIEYFEFNNVSTSKIGYRAKDQLVFNQAIPQILGDSPPNLSDTNLLCTRGYTSKIKNTTCYEAFGTPLSWTDAQTACAQNSYGALASVGSAFENSDLLAYAKNTFPSCTGFYIGLFKSGYTPNWIWVNYDPSAYRNWKSGSPSQNPSCVVLNANDGSWTNQACDTPQCYACSLSV